MKIVIDIPKEDYILAKKEDFSAVYDGNHVAKAIKHGTPLPKHHGRLGDLDRVKAMVFNASMDEYFMPTNLLTCDDITDIIDYTPTIIEGE